jgi:chromosome segregation ATPase
MESGNRTAEIEAAAIKEYKDRTWPDWIISDKHIAGIKDGIRFHYKQTVSIYQQCEALQSENERLKIELSNYAYQVDLAKSDRDRAESENTRLLERVKELTEALRSIEPFASEVVSRQTNESVFGYNSQMLTLSSLKKIVSALTSGKESK